MFSQAWKKQETKGDHSMKKITAAIFILFRGESR